MSTPRQEAPISTETHDFDALIERLRALLSAAERDPVAIDIELDLLGERWLDTVHRGDHTEMQQGWRRLRRLFEWAATGLNDDDFEADERFHLGRLASLVELTASAAARTPLPAVLAAVETSRLRDLLEALGRSPGAANRDLATATQSTEPRVSKDLARLIRVGLVDSRRVGRRRTSYLTLRGQEALADHARRQAATPSPATKSHWRPPTPVAGLP